MDIHGSDGELAVRQVYPEIPALVQKLTRQLPGKLDFLRFQIIMIPIHP
jgi:septation ring formation regulator EzrA